MKSISLARLLVSKGLRKKARHCYCSYHCFSSDGSGDDLSWETFIVKQNKENSRDIICNEQEMVAVNNGVQMKAFSIVFSPPWPHWGFLLFFFYKEALRIKHRLEKCLAFSERKKLPVIEECRLWSCRMQSARHQIFVVCLPVACSALRRCKRVSISSRWCSRLAPVPCFLYFHASRSLLPLSAHVFHHLQSFSGSPSPLPCLVGHPWVMGISAPGGAAWSHDWQEWVYT